MKIFPAIIALLLLAGTATVPARAAGDMPDCQAEHVLGPAALKQIFSGYEAVRAALADDDLGLAKIGAKKLVTDEIRKLHAGVANSAQDLAKAGDITAARRAFKILSNETIALARTQKGYFILHCPMADADWVQGTREVANPYLGKDMSACGTVTEATKG
jgi:hypothetical protein